MHRLFVCSLLAFLIAATLHAGDAELAATLKSKGAEITETNGAVTGISFRDCTALKQELPKTELRWTAPTEANKRRIDALFK